MTSDDQPITSFYLEIASYDVLATSYDLPLTSCELPQFGWLQWLRAHLPESATIYSTLLHKDVNKSTPRTITTMARLAARSTFNSSRLAFDLPLLAQERRKKTRRIRTEGYHAEEVVVLILGL